MIINILGDSWKVTVIPIKTFKQRFKQCTAITLINSKEIFFTQDSMIFLYVAHEITHAFYYYMCKQELKLSTHDDEEFTCDFVAIHGKQILDLTDKVIKKLGKKKKC